MSIKYLKVKKKPITFFKLFEISAYEFEITPLQILPLHEWKNKVLESYKDPSRPYNYSLEDDSFLYYRSGITQEIVGYLSALAKSRVC